MKHPLWQHSLCKNYWLHRLDIADQYPEGVMEICQICGMQKFFRIIDGKVNNYDYMLYHQRQGLHPLNPLFAREYPQYASINI